MEEKIVKNHLVVTCAIFIDRGGEKTKFLLTQRADNLHNGGRWEFPGGKFDYPKDANYRICLEREIAEEFDGLQVKAGQMVEASVHYQEDKDRCIHLLGFLCEITSGELKKTNEIQDFTWVTADEFSNYDITENDLPHIEALKNYFS